jgi:hypothetical protein
MAKKLPRPAEGRNGPSTLTLWSALGWLLSLGGAGTALFLSVKGAWALDLGQEIAWILVGFIVTIEFLKVVVAHKGIFGPGVRWYSRLGSIVVYLALLGFTVSFGALHVGKTQATGAIELKRALAAKQVALDQQADLKARIESLTIDAARAVRDPAVIMAERKSIANSGNCDSRRNAKTPMCSQFAQLLEEHKQSEDVHTARTLIERYKLDLKKVVVPEVDAASEAGKAFSAVGITVKGWFTVPISWVIAIMAELFILGGATLEFSGVSGHFTTFHHVSPPTTMVVNDPPPTTTIHHQPPPFTTMMVVGSQTITAEKWVMKQLELHGCLTGPQSRWSIQAGVSASTMSRAIQHLTGAGRVKWGAGPMGERELRAAVQPTLSIVKRQS